MHTDFCVEALHEAIARHGSREIMTTDQGSHFTGAVWITKLTGAGIRISMDVRERCLDTIFIERLWPSLKQEAIYLEAISDGSQTHRIVGDWTVFYNVKWPNSALDRRPLNDAYGRAWVS